MVRILARRARHVCYTLRKLPTLLHRRGRLTRADFVQKSSSTLLHIRRTATNRILVLISLLGGSRHKKSHFRCMLSICVSEVQLRLLQHNLPIPDSWSAANSLHSMTSSVRRMSWCGIVNPSVLAVRRLTTNSNFVHRRIQSAPSRQLDHCALTATLAAPS